VGKLARRLLMVGLRDGNTHERDFLMASFSKRVGIVVATFSALAVYSGCSSGPPTERSATEAQALDAGGECVLAVQEYKPWLLDSSCQCNFPVGSHGYYECKYEQSLLNCLRFAGYNVPCSQLPQLPIVNTSPLNYNFRDLYLPAYTQVGNCQQLNDLYNCVNYTNQHSGANGHPYNGDPVYAHMDSNCQTQIVCGVSLLHGVFDPCQGLQCYN
jgi:hypothetical protein